MQDTTYGWTVEMQLKAAKLGHKTRKCPSVPPPDRLFEDQRHGEGYRTGRVQDLYTIFKYR
jgi:hypothetical protein